MNANLLLSLLCGIYIWLGASDITSNNRQVVFVNQSGEDLIRIVIENDNGETFTVYDQKTALKQGANFSYQLNSQECTWEVRVSSAADSWSYGPINLCTESKIILN
ncbi:hypothetical protein [Eisenibacter elegans]|jgi:hypothetical protein|uniref:hypothetical protein n=1 Tax=Eisenibacter elegans TaxID=997 RepID=UPI0003FD9E78|nr:hypothetical protein [Eisenibacter elegans]